MRVAVVSDVHGNAVALAAVLAELEREQPDLIVSGGDLTWGPLPEETFALVSGLGSRFVRGNADRAVLENKPSTEREQWMQAHHTPEMREFLAGFEENVVVEVDGLGPVRVCHGSPRSDEECVTPETPEARVREFAEGVDERVIVTAHVHIQFDREVAGSGASTRGVSACRTRAGPAPMGAPRARRGAAPDRVRPGGGGRALSSNRPARGRGDHRADAEPS